MNEKRVDKIAWGIMYFLLVTGGAILLLGVYALADLVF